MNNFFELEKKCKKYHQKRLLKLWLLPFFILLLILVAVFYFLKNQPEKKSLQPQTKPQTKKIQIKKTIIHKNKPIKKEENITKTEPKPQPKKLIQPPKETIPTLKAKIDLDMIDFSENKKHFSDKKEENITKQHTKIVEINKTKPLKKEKTKSGLIITKEFPSFETSFKLMNLYYKDEDYAKAKEWAIKASKVKPKDEEVWRIYALSLYKLNNKNKAIKVLKTYLQYQESEKIKETLKQIEEGK